MYIDICTFSIRKGLMFLRSLLGSESTEENIQEKIDIVQYLQINQYIYFYTYILKYIHTYHT